MKIYTFSRKKNQLTNRMEFTSSYVIAQYLQHI